ncbi:hypothetical protein D3C85_1074120 [compost metagenome]
MVACRLGVLPQQEETASTQARAIGLDHRQGGTDGYGGVERIAAVLQNAPAGGGGLRVGAGDGGLPGRLRLGDDAAQRQCGAKQQ